NATGDFDITQAAGTLTISGAGSATTIIDAQGFDRVFDVRTLITVNFSGVTIENGLTDPTNTQGGGVRAITAGTTLNFSSDIIKNNTDQGAGGGVYLEGGTISVSSTTFSGNTAGSSGGGFVNEGSFTVNHTTVLNSNISDNTSGDAGGGFAVYGHSTASA